MAWRTPGPAGSGGVGRAHTTRVRCEVSRAFVPPVGREGAGKGSAQALRSPCVAFPLHAVPLSHGALACVPPLPSPVCGRMYTPGSMRRKVTCTGPTPHACPTPHARYHAPHARHHALHGHGCLAPVHGTTTQEAIHLFTVPDGRLCGGARAGPAVGLLQGLAWVDGMGAFGACRDFLITGLLFS